MERRQLHVALVASLLGAFVVAGCGGAPPTAATPTAVQPVDTQAQETEHKEEAEQTEEAEHMGEAEHTEEAEHMAEAEHNDDHSHGADEHMSGAGHGVPEEAAAVPNPIDTSDESVVLGAALYETSCAVCHGETGEGDGPGAAGLEKEPADLHEGHVQDLSDGALFHIISHGISETPMPAWENVLSEEDRWHVVNFLRTFSE
jgi:mono/diheme cytochrome c family protein